MYNAYVHFSELFHSLNLQLELVYDAKIRCADGSHLKINMTIERLDKL